MRWNAEQGLLAAGVLVLLVLAAGWLVVDRRDGGEAPAPRPGKDTAPVATTVIHPSLRAGLDALDAGDRAGAMEHLRRVPPGDPAHPTARRNLALLLEDSGDLEGAVRAYRELLDVQPDAPEPYLRLGRVLYALGRHAEAELAALRALEVAPRALDARYDVALFRTAQDRVADALAAYERAVRLDPANAHGNQARERLRQLAERNPTLPAVHFALAYFANRDGDSDAEVRHLERFLELSPAGPVADSARLRLSLARARTGASRGGP